MITNQNMAKTPDDTGPGHGAPSSGGTDGVTMGADRLSYMADMILELQQMAQRSGSATLAGILALAHVEAERERSRVQS